MKAIFGLVVYSTVAGRWIKKHRDTVRKSVSPGSCDAGHTHLTEWSPLLRGEESDTYEEDCSFITLEPLVPDNSDAKPDMFDVGALALMSYRCQLFVNLQSLAEQPSYLRFVADISDYGALVRTLQASEPFVMAPRHCS